MVSLIGNDHAPYLMEGKPVAAEAIVEVPGEPGLPGHTLELDVADGRVRGGVQTIEVAQGTQVEITITANLADSVHVHGYDLTVPVDADQPALVRFRAHIPGVLEVELEESGLLIAEVIVR